MFKSDRPNDRQRQNRLAGEKSPYLLQHADNPVDWYPWGEEAFTRARAENKPIFLSIGYSTCHWCHVMAHESFENETVAALMNREFINIKVDREERPDVDRVYMTFVQATTGHGGWPMSVWLTPDLHPFVGGTYFPPEDRYGQPGFPSVLQKIAAAWRADRDRIAGQGARIIEALREAQTKSRGSSGAIDPAAIEEAFSQFSGSFDAAEGGFGNAPKFPHPVTLNFLTRFYAGHRDSDDRKRALEMLTFTLGKMAAGGMDDHLGGGFHRYSVDRYWHVPHFEKMLYDQAQLAVAYLEVFQITADPEFASVARDVLDYVARDMTSKEGAFFSAEDADSPDPENPAHNIEGAFYVWTRAEIDSALGKEADLFCFHYGVEAEGNAPSGSDPHGELSGKNVLILRHTIPETAAHFKREEKEVAQSLTTSRQTLWAVREKRPRPHRDDKIITAWNGLMISAFARAGAVLSERRYIDLAACDAEWLRTHVWDDGVLYRSYREGRSAVEGFADDYAFLIQGLVDLYEATFDLRWLEWANELQTKQDELFWDDENGGYFSTTGRDASVMLRMKEENDGAEPAPSSVAAQNLLRLSQYENRPEWRKQAEKTVAAFQTMLSHYPSAMPQMLGVVDALSRSSRQIVIAGTKDAADTGALVAEVQRHFLPNKVLLLADGGESQKYFGERLPEIGEMKPVGEKAAAYVCENFTCQAAVTDPQELGRVLSR